MWGIGVVPYIGYGTLFALHNKSVMLNLSSCATDVVVVVVGLFPIPRTRAQQHKYST